MNKLNVLLICGSGASTGFMAVSLRKAVKKQGLEITVEARSEAELEGRAAEADCIMLGPHLAYLQEELAKKFEAKGIKVAVMDKKYYSVLDGEAALKHILSLF
jgi:PTS system cellobiose-specific IIB component